MPTGEHWPSCFALRRREVLLFDCCEGTQKHMMRCGISYARINAIFLSHMHADHFLGLFGLIRSFNMFGRTDPLRIFGPRGAGKVLQTIFELKPLRPAFPVIIKEVAGADGQEIYATELFIVRAFSVEHGTSALGYAYEERGRRRFDVERAAALGIRGALFGQLERKGVATVKGKRIKLEDVTYEAPGRRVVYSGDTVPCSAVTRAAAGATLLIHDACYAEADAALAKENWHSTARQAALLAKEAGAKRLLLTHISNRYHNRRSLLDEAREVFPNVELAKEGLELHL